MTTNRDYENKLNKTIVDLEKKIIRLEREARDDKRTITRLEDADKVFRQRIAELEDDLDDCSNSLERERSNL